MPTPTQSQSDARAFVHSVWAKSAEPWTARADEIDVRSAEVTARMLAGVALQRGDAVVDLAAGPGGAGLAAADAIGADADVLISDVVPAMVEAAAQRIAARGLTAARAAVIDIEDIDLADQSFDVVLCREGLMFALDTRRALSEMFRILRPNGRVAIAVWGPRAANPWLGVLLDCIEEVTGLVLPPPGMPGPLALSDTHELVARFTDTGFVDITTDTVSVPLYSDSFDAWWTRNLTVAGPVVGVVNGLDAETRSRLRTRLQAAVAPYTRADGALELPGVAVVLTARRSQ